MVARKLSVLGKSVNVTHERRRECVFSRLASLSTRNGELARQDKKYIYLNNGNKLFKADCFSRK